MALSHNLGILKSSLSCCIYDGAQHADVLIKECDKLATLTKVTLKIGSGDWFAFSPDQGRGKEALMSPLLARGKMFNHHRACDCVIVMCQDNCLTVVYVDLKSGNPVGYEGQFKSTRQFMRYVLELHNEFQQVGLKLSREEYIILYGGEVQPSIRKKGTARRLERHSCPSNAYKKLVPNGATLYLKEFL